MPNKKHFNFYNRCIKEKEMPYNGLCSCAKFDLISEKLLNLFEPTEENEIELDKKNKSLSYWGYEPSLTSNKYSSYDKCYKFTALRQTIVLLMAAMNNEL